MKVRRNEAGSVLIIVLWVAFGLVALTLYFANSMSFELRASDNRASAIEADQAIAGAARYVSNVLATVKEPATLPDINNYRSDAVPVSDAMAVPPSVALMLSPAAKLPWLLGAKRTTTVQVAAAASGAPEQVSVPRLN